MFSTFARRALGGAASVLLIAGCSHGATSVTPSLHSPSQGQSQSRVIVGYRTLPGPAVAGPLIVPIWSAPEAGYLTEQPSVTTILYVADANNNKVVLFNPNKANPTPIGQITTGINAPIGLSVDKHGTLYVVNIANNTVTEYLHGHTSPSFTITTGLAGPYGIAVDSSLNVFVSNLNNNTVTAYHAHKSSPYATISGVGPNPVGLGIDHKNNVFVCDDSDNTIYEIPHGSTTAQNSGLTQLTGPINIVFAPLDSKAYVSDFGSTQVAIYLKGQTAPSTFITDGISQPTLNGMAKPGNFFQSDQTGPVHGYHAGKVHPYSSISGLGRPAGIASYPRI
jgi:hypothetical protein